MVSVKYLGNLMSLLGKKIYIVNSASNRVTFQIKTSFLTLHAAIVKKN